MFYFEYFLCISDPSLTGEQKDLSKQIFNEINTIRFYTSRNQILWNEVMYDATLKTLFQTAYKNETKRENVTIIDCKNKIIVIIIIIV